MAASPTSTGPTLWSLLPADVFTVLVHFASLESFASLTLLCRASRRCVLAQPLARLALWLRYGLSRWPHEATLYRMLRVPTSNPRLSAAFGEVLLESHVLILRTPWAAPHALALLESDHRTPDEIYLALGTHEHLPPSPAMEAVLRALEKEGRCKLLDILDAKGRGVFVKLLSLRFSDGRYVLGSPGLGSDFVWQRVLSQGHLETVHTPIAGLAPAKDVPWFAARQRSNS